MSESDRYIFGRGTLVELRGEPFHVMVHLALVGGRVTCVGVDIKGFEQEIHGDGSFHIDAGDGFTELTTPRLRGLRLGEVVDEAIAYTRSLVDEAADYPNATWTEEQLTRLDEERAALDAAADRPRRPGRPASLSHPDVLQLVVETYTSHVAAGGRRPVIAVREALQKAGVIEGAAADGVTINQARAAIRHARSKKLLAQKGRS